MSLQLFAPFASSAAHHPQSHVLRCPKQGAVHVFSTSTFTKIVFGQVHAGRAHNAFQTPYSAQGKLFFIFRPLNVYSMTRFRPFRIPLYLCYIPICSNFSVLSSLDVHIYFVINIVSRRVYPRMLLKINIRTTDIFFFSFPLLFHCISI